MKNTYTAVLLVFIIGLDALYQIESFRYFSSSSAAPIRQATPSDCHLRVNFTEWKPFQFFNSKGEAQGVQIELINKILKAAGCEVSFREKRFFRTIEELKSGDVDMVLNATITDNRKKFAHFSIPYRTEILVLYATSPFINRCKEDSLAVLINNGFRLGLQKESVYGESVDNIQRQQQLRKKIHYMDSISKNYELIMKNEIDGIIDEPIAAAYHIRKNHLEKKLMSCQVTVYSNPVSIMFSKKSVPQDIIKRINTAINKVKKTDYYRNTWRWQ